MTTIRNATFAAATALALVMVGCGSSDSCAEQTPPIAGVPSCGALSGQSVIVPLRVCPRCDQATPTCTVDMTNVGAGAIELVALSEVCEANSSCPIVDPDSCPFAPLNCIFNAPTVAVTTEFDLVVITPDGQLVPNKTLTVIPAGSPAACGGFSL